MRHPGAACGDAVFEARATQRGDLLEKAVLPHRFDAGVEARGEGLVVRAELPDGWDQFRIRRWFRGALYTITVRRGADGEPRGCFVNGEAWDAECLPVAPPGSEQQVVITL